MRRIVRFLDRVNIRALQVVFGSMLLAFTALLKVSPSLRRVTLSIGKFILYVLTLVGMAVVASLIGAKRMRMIYGDKPQPKPSLK